MNVLSEWDTVAMVLAHGLSMARAGDGEIKLARGESCKTQPHDPELTKRMRRVLRHDDERVLVCIPRIWPDEPPLATPGFWPQHRAAFERFCDPAKSYGSAFVSRRDAWPIPNEPLYWQTWQEIWRDRPVLLITGSGKGGRTRGLLGAAASVDMLDCPRQGAWSAHEGLRADALAWVGAKQRPIVALACGATATVLAHELGVRGVQALDLGHMQQAFARVNPKELSEP